MNKGQNPTNKSFLRRLGESMPKITAVLVALLLTTSLAAAAAGADSNRKVTRQYTMAHGMVVHDSSSTTWSVGAAWTEFRPQSGERFISLAISDAADRNVYGHVHLDADGNGKVEHLDFCDETRKPIQLGTAKKVEVAVFLGTCPDGTSSVVTQGTITATFSR